MKFDVVTISFDTPKKQPFALICISVLKQVNPHLSCCKLWRSIFHRDMRWIFYLTYGFDGNPRLLISTSPPLETTLASASLTGRRTRHRFFLFVLADGFFEMLEKKEIYILLMVQKSVKPLIAHLTSFCGF